MPGKRWLELTWKDFRQMDTGRTLVLFPLGSTEQHGPCLPVGTDTLLVGAVIERILEGIDDVPFVVLPTLWCTKSNEHIAFPGTVFLRTETLMSVVHDVCTAVVRAGFKKLVLMNWHGGNSNLLGTLVQDIYQRHGLLTFLIDVVRMGVFVEKSSINEVFDIHAGKIETSMLLASYPDLVRDGWQGGLGAHFGRGRLGESYRGCKHLTPESGQVLVSWRTEDLTEDGVIGDTTGANAADGDTLIRQQVHRVQAFLREVAAFEYRGK
ncbi:MAG TPA: creatininase family protein [Firmicutes bacterium]|nr:creatininase family protein [Bacillota bacterium]